MVIGRRFFALFYDLLNIVFVLVSNEYNGFACVYRQYLELQDFPINCRNVEQCMEQRMEQCGRQLNEQRTKKPTFR